MKFIVGNVGVYGDVQRVKILYNKKDSALIQLAEPHQAHLGTKLFLITSKNYLNRDPFLFILCHLVTR